MSTPTEPEAAAAADPYRLLERDTIAEPYPVYARLRSEDPVHWSVPWSGWLLTRYDDVVAGFRDPRLSSERAQAKAQQIPSPVPEDVEPLLRNLASWVLYVDAPVHTRLRSLINKAFTPRLVEGLRPRIEAIVAELLDAAEARGRIDIVRDLGGPLPVLVIGEMLGLPAEDWQRLKGWSDTLASFLGAGRRTMEIARVAAEGVREMEDYLRAALAERRARPGHDLLSRLLAAEEEGAILGEQELLSTCCTVLFGGHETTTNLIGNAVLALLRSPAELDALRAGRAPIEGAVEELMRYDGPIQRMGRTAREDMEIRGREIKKGDLVFLSLGSANRDPAHFPDPDRLDLRRADVRHLGFGMGAHYCIGAALGRLEAQISLEAFARRFPRAELAPGPLSWLPTFSIRGLHALPVLLG